MCFPPQVSVTSKPRGEMRALLIVICILIDLPHPDPPPRKHLPAHPPDPRPSQLPPGSTLPLLDVLLTLKVYLVLPTCFACNSLHSICLLLPSFHAFRFLHLILSFPLLSLPFPAHPLYFSFSSPLQLSFYADMSTT